MPSSRASLDKSPKKALQDESKRRSDSRYPSNEELVNLMRRFGTYPKVAEQLDVKRESLKDFLAIRPNLKSRMDALRKYPLTDEQRKTNKLTSARDWQRKYRANNPEEARRVRREQMSKYDSNYRRKWNHYNRVRRLNVGGHLDEESIEYLEIIKNDPCVYCGEPFEENDHIVSISKGGMNNWTNFAPTCMSCNRRKHTSSVLDFMLKAVI